MLVWLIGPSASSILDASLNVVCYSASVTCTICINYSPLIIQGCAFLYVAKEHQSTIRPLVVSWGFNHGFSAEFAWIGIELLNAI